MYKLIINTNSYTGNFERELMAYCLGRTKNGSGGYTAFSRPFWDQVVGTGVETYENYVVVEKQYRKDRESVSYDESVKDLCIRRGLTEDDAIQKAKEIKEKVNKKMYDEDILRVYEDYLLFTMQWIDDWEEETFYNICPYEGDEYTAVYVQLQKPLNEYFENIVIPRIIKFFEDDIYNKVEDYIYFCKGYKYEPKEPFILKDLVLVDEEGNIIKDYLK